MIMALRLYNTYSRSKEEVAPVEENKIKMYLCGPTIYDYIHIGNARPLIIFDVFRRFLLYRGYEVTYVVNLTDIDDKIIERAVKEGKDTSEITEKYGQAFFEDMEALGVRKADTHPKATEHVQEIVDLIQALIEHGYAYQVDGDVFYAVDKFKKYGELSGKNIEDLRAGARVDVNEKKRNPLDFALWKHQKPGEPSWESPWGPGRPGWHIECSAMSMKLLGKTLDIHAGGVDLIFPHHENEIAQSEGATNQRFVKYWMHNGFLEIEGEKMAKSLGNFRTVRDVLKIYPGEVIRMFFLQKHYRSPVDFSQKGLETAASASSRLRIFSENLDKVVASLNLDETEVGAVETLQHPVLSRFRKLKSELIEAMEDDLNTPIALSKLFDMVKEVNKLLSQPEYSRDEQVLLGYLKNEFGQFDDIFGLVVRGMGYSGPMNNLIDLLIDVRNELRTKKEYQLADQIRDELGRMGIILEDKDSDTNWRIDETAVRRTEKK